MSRKADLGSSAAVVSGVKGVPPGYEVLRSCGEGTFGQVFLCKSDTGKHVAIKTIKQEGSKQVCMLMLPAERRQQQLWLTAYVTAGDRRRAACHHSRSITAEGAVASEHPAPRVCLCE